MRFFVKILSRINQKIQIRKVFPDQQRLIVAGNQLEDGRTDFV